MCRLQWSKTVHKSEPEISSLWEFKDESLDDVCKKQNHNIELVLSKKNIYFNFLPIRNYER